MRKIKRDQVFSSWSLGFSIALHPLLFKLRLVQLRIYPILRQQFIVRAALDDFSRSLKSNRQPRYFLNC